MTGKEQSQAVFGLITSGTLAAAIIAAAGLLLYWLIG